jgi:hypothetical protein
MQTFQRPQLQTQTTRKRIHPYNGLPAQGDWLDLDDLPPSWQPSDQDVAFYQEHGWWVTPQVIPDGVIERALAGCDRLYRGERDARLPVEGGYSDWRPGDGAGVRNNEFISLQNHDIRELALQPIIGAIAGRLAQTRRIRLFDDQVIFKPPSPQNAASDGDSSAVGWHADKAYWSTCTSDQLLTAWIPLHDCTLEQGPLVVLDGSHRWPGIEHLRDFNQTDLAGRIREFERQGQIVKPVAMTLKRGQMSFHHCWAIHGSYPCVGDIPRLALAVHLQDGGNRYRAVLTQQGKPVQLFHEQICRPQPNGYPDFTDPAAFPTLWSADDLSADEGRKD